jgi:hypothetical protein
MRTTIDIPDAVFREAKARAAAEGVSLREVVVRSVRGYLLRPRRAGYAFRWASEGRRGGLLIPEDVLNSHAALLDYLDRLG